MALNFCANLGFLFKDNDMGLLDRYAAAGKAGFRAVEAPFPEGIPLETVRDALISAGITQILINIMIGDAPNGQFGVAAFPDSKDIFRANFLETVRYAKGLGIKKIHIMAGKLELAPTAENDATYIENLKFAASILENEDIIGVIEPINNYSLPGYYMNNYKKAVSILQEVNSPKIRIMFDIFHMQLIQGNISNTFKELLPYLGHIQIAQVPDRHEPDSKGELEYGYIFNLINELDYKDWIGLEYVPLTNTVDGLSWVKDLGFEL